MSRRARVPKRKQLGSSHRQRNANPKLSPYQKEQKRDRMANQPPVSIQTRDFPASARRLQFFLASRSDQTSRPQGKKADETDFVPSTKGIARNEQSLNAQLRVSPTVEDTATLKRLEKKKKSSAKKREKRREDRIERLHAQNDALDMMVNKDGAKALRRDATLAKEVKLALKQASVTQRRSKKKPRADGDAAPAEGEDKTDGTQQQARPQPSAEPPRPQRDFDDLIDVVGFGERADAPPTFDVLPKTTTALLPTQHIGKTKLLRMQEEERRAKVQRLLSGIAAPSQTKMSTTPLPNGDVLEAATVKNARLETADDFAALRERVMARYAKKNQGTFNQRRRNIVFTTAEEAATE
jgi:hypothetical protein